MFIKTPYRRARLVTIPPSGFGRDENQNPISVLPFLNQEGTVIECDDLSYEAERPTGFERTHYLIDFNGTRLWIPRASYVGEDTRTNRSIWHDHLNLYTE